MSLEAALDGERLQVLASLEGLFKNNNKQNSSEIDSAPSTTRAPFRSMLDVDGQLHSPPTSTSSRQTGTHSKKHSVDLGSSLLPSSNMLSFLSGSSAVDPESQFSFEMKSTVPGQALPKRVTMGGKLKSKSGSSPNRRSSGTSGFPGIIPPTNEIDSPLLPSISDLPAAHRRLSEIYPQPNPPTHSNLFPKPKPSDENTQNSSANSPTTSSATDDGDEDVDSETGEPTGLTGTLADKIRSINIDGGSTAKRTRGHQAIDSRKLGTGVRHLSMVEEGMEAERTSVLALNTRRNTGHPNRKPVQPHTSFDPSWDHLCAPKNSQSDARDECANAAKIKMSASPILNTPENNRCIRQIIRGNFESFQNKNEGGHRQRVYLVASDLGEEAAYALEWTIGAILRDGDTLLLVYAIEDSSIGPAEQTAGTLTIGDISKEPGSIVRSLSKHMQRRRLSSRSPTQSPASHERAHSAGPSRTFHKKHGLDSNVASPRKMSEAGERLLKAHCDGDIVNLFEGPPHLSIPGSIPDAIATMSKAEQERWDANMQVSDRCMQLLRKTRLQVRVLVEVFHCKSPRRMLIDVIDCLNPTLVVLGSRRRSQLKGVLLGSFSNYMVTKSSVPVMVARKRLRHYSKRKKANAKIPNVLASSYNKLETNTASLMSAYLGKAQTKILTPTRSLSQPSARVSICRRQSNIEDEQWIPGILSSRAMALSKRGQGYVLSRRTADSIVTLRMNQQQLHEQRQLQNQHRQRVVVVQGQKWR